MTRYAAVLLLSVLAACSGDDPVAPAPLSISVFTAAPGTLAKGGSTTLVFSANNAEKLSLTPGIGDVTGKTQVTVSPTETTVYTLTATRGADSASKGVTVTVGPTATTGFKLAMAGPLVAGTPVNVTVTAVDSAGATVPSYEGTVHLVSNDGKAQLPADFSFTAVDKGVKTVPVTFRTAGPHLLIANGTVGGGMTGSLSTTSGPLAVKAGAAKHLRLAGLPSETESGLEVPLQVSFVDAFDNASAEHTGTLRILLSDDSAPALADVTAAHGAASATVTFFKAGVHTVTVQDIGNDTLRASAEVRVKPSTAVSYALSALPASARAGEPLALTVTAMDRKGNRAQGYTGRARFTSTDATAQLPAEATFSEGVAHVSLSFRGTGSHTVTASEVGGSLTATTPAVSVSAAAVASLVLSGAGPATAGVETSVTATVKDRYGNTVTGYAGTVSLTSTDAQAQKPATYTFTAADAGVHAFAVTFKTSGAQELTVADASASASATFAVSAASAASCELTDVPTSANAGTSLPARVTVRDAFSNLVTDYSGTVTLTSTDSNPSAVMPAPATFVPAQDRGSRLFSLKLVSGGSHTVTATGTGGLSCQANVTVTATGPRLVVTLPADANASYPVSAMVSVKDEFGNVLADYTGSVSFSSTDAAATLPADVAFTAADGGSKTVSVTFNTLGVQQLTATQVGEAGVSAKASTSVHGLLYTDPTPNQGKVRLVLNAARSTASVVQLDLVANFSLTASGAAASARGGVYSAGMNLPVDTTRAVADSTLLVEGNALTLGTAPKAVAAALPESGPTAGVLYTGVSQKFDGAGKVTGDTSVTPGRVFYSVRLKLPATATVGTVFDGASLGAKFRAAVRNRAGDEVLQNADFVLGKLEVR